ncbi:hypothetical protein J7J83_03005 [bacterium]|nr:hypothetical protein [bacterium]
MEKRRLKIVLAILLNIIMVTGFVPLTYAAVTTPQKMIYEGRLLDSSGSTPLIGSHDFRFSFWSVSPVGAGDISVGEINILSPTYSGWEEVQSVVPNVDGFFSFELGTVSPIPQIDSTKHLYLQIEVKATGDPNTSYEILDRAPSDPTSDRSPIGTVPYATNSDYIDNAEIGGSAGDIVILDTGNVWPISTIPGGTNSDNFTVDNDDDATTSIELQFGNTLSKILSWDMINGYFNFNDNVNIQGNLTITGTVDGVDVSNLASTVNSHLDGGSSKHDASEIDVEATDGHYYSVGDLETAIDTIDEQVFSLSATSSNLKKIIPSLYDGVSYKPDGTNNIGRLFIDSDLTNGRNFYVWKSTQSSLQDYDVIVQVPLPTNFSGWNGMTPWEFNYRSDSANSNDNKADIYIYDSAGAAVTLTGTSTGLANTVWSSTSIGYSGTPTFTAGETFMIVIRMHSRNNNEMHLGEISLNFT